MNFKDITLADISTETKVETLGIVLDQKLEELSSTVYSVAKEKGEQGDKGEKGDKGDKGEQGVPGKDSKDGINGKDGKDGVDGKDGEDGLEAPKIIDAEVALDDTLLLTLSDGTEIKTTKTIVGQRGLGGANGSKGDKGDAGVGIAAAGTTGQVLTKVSSADYDTTWTTVSAGSGTVTSVAATVPSVLSITGSPITTSGTLAIGYSGTALPIANGGTGATTAAEAFSDLTPLTLTTASATPLVLTNTSGYQQQIIGSTSQTITLPSTATLAVGWSFLITNGTGFTVTVNTSTGATVYTNSNIGSYRVWCISTANNNAASWSVGAETFSFETGTGSVVRATAPTFTGIVNVASLTASSTLTGNSTVSLLGSTNSTTALGTNATTGSAVIGGTSQTGTITLGRSTVSQQIDIQAGATASGSTKTINIGTAGLSGSTTNIAIGSAVSGATSRTTLNGIVIDSISAAVSAAGTTQGTATGLVSNINNVTVVATGATGVRLPTAVAGMRILVRNSDSADTLSIYPATGGTINALSANAAFTLAAGSTIELMATTATQWYTF